MAAVDQQPILASDRISDVLKRHPEVLDDLIGLSPHFEKLRNPVLRKVQSRLVTVAQAAAIAGLNAADVTRRLNVAAGITERVPEQPVSTGDGALAAPPDWLADVTIAAEVDARPLLARGEEPFKEIMAAARQVPARQAFRLLAGFEPVPLYDVLAKQGFEHATAHPSADLWAVTFYRREQKTDPPDTERASDHARESLDWEETATAQVTIDVTELVPPEPMIKVLEALEALPDDGRLLVHHVRRPMHLYDRLDEMGYPHETRTPGPGKVDVLIQKRTPVAT